MNTVKKIAAGVLGLTLAIGGLTACSSDGVEEYQDRQELNSQYNVDNSLELKNLREKRDREDDPNAIRYVYVMSYATIIGYYVAEGKISSSGSQIAPETEFVRPCAGCDRSMVESAKDDGSYGDGDPGIFFFTTEGVMIETSLDYITSDVPMKIDVPRLVD